LALTGLSFYFHRDCVWQLSRHHLAITLIDALAYLRRLNFSVAAAHPVAERKALPWAAAV
jgi:hypothetical protein